MEQVTAILAATSTYDENLTGTLAVDLHPEVLRCGRRQQLSRGTTGVEEIATATFATKKRTILPTTNIYARD